MKNYLILVIDDSADNLRIITNFLKESGLSLTILNAPNGKIGCMLAEKKLPDLIITDWEMPEMDGIETIKYIKGQKSTKEIPIIMATGVMTSTADLKIAMEAGAVDYIRKPIDKTELTARIHSMLKLADSYKEIKLLNATKDKFFSIIAHDLRNPFQSILGFSELLIKGYNEFTDDKRLEYIKIIGNNSETNFKLLEDLLTWSRTQSDKIEYTPEPINLQALVSETILVLKLHTDKKEIKVINNVDNDVIAYVDKNSVTAIIRNLLSNAIKFTPQKGSVTISTQPAQTKEDIKYIEICVSDTGVGIPAEKIGKLFKVEKHISTIGTNDERGTGLGLTLCKEFVEKNNGKIWIESEEGKGSEFMFTLPLLK